MYQELPPQPAPRPRRRLNPLQIILIVLAVVGAAVYLYTSLAPVTSPYAVITSGTLGAHYTGDVLIVRDETPYDAEGVSSVEYIAEEGSTVYLSDNICNVYSNGYSTSLSTALQGYRDQIRDYEMNRILHETTYDARMDRLDNEVLDLAREFRLMMSGQRGNLLNQESLLSAAVLSRQRYVRQKYATDQRLSRLLDDEQSQLQRIGSWTKQYVATGTGIVSFYTDGYEYGLTLSNYSTFNPQQVRRMIGGSLPDVVASAGKSTIYRIVRDGVWYMLFLTKDPNWNPTEGSVYEVKLERFENTSISAMVESFTRSGGELLVRLRVEGPVSPVMYIRSCTASLGDYVTSLCVPKRAIYTQDNMTGVVILDGANRLFVPVSVLLENGDDVYIEPIQQGLLYVGETVCLF